MVDQEDGIDDRQRVLDAVVTSVATYKKAVEGYNLLTRPSASKELLGTVSDTIAGTAAFKSMTGKILFTGNSGVIVTPAELASGIFYWAEAEPEKAVDWLFRVLATKETRCFFRAAIWGLELDREVVLPSGARLMPFNSLPESVMRDRIKSRARAHDDESAWHSPNYYAVPSVAYVVEIENFPYIRATNEAFILVDEIESQAWEYWSLIEGLVVGQPLAVAHWFEYEDSDLDLRVNENTPLWHFPEIHPNIKEARHVSADAIVERLDQFSKLPGDFQSRLRRSMDRFSLSQCRHQQKDQILDLALAFEIAISSDGSNAPPSMKVSIRTAQMIGGPIAKRMRIRAAVEELYGLRSQATHGGSVKTKEQAKLERALAACPSIYADLLQGFLALGAAPNWKLLELQPRRRRAGNG